MPPSGFRISKMPSNCIRILQMPSNGIQIYKMSPNETRIYTTNITNAAQLNSDIKLPWGSTLNIHFGASGI